MKINSTFISLFLLLGVFQLSAQIVATPSPSRNCAELVQVRQQCERDGTVTLSFYLANNSRCDARGVSITPAGGFGQSFPINIPAQTVSNYLFTYAGYAQGSQACFEIILHGANGRECCRTRVCIDINCCERNLDCTGLTFTRNQSNGTANFYQETFVSGVTATLTATLWAARIPDQLIITINGNQVLNFSAGAHPCDGPSLETETRVFCVRPCDNITFTVIGDNCPLGGTTAWSLSVACRDGCNIIGNKIISDTDSDKLSSRSFAKSLMEEEDAMQSKNSEPVLISPNPVTDLFQISNLDSTDDYNTARVINSSGKVIHTENISNKDRIYIDAATYPRGIYFLEITDIYGYRVLEKFMKQ